MTTGSGSGRTAEDWYSPGTMHAKGRTSRGGSNSARRRTLRGMDAYDELYVYTMGRPNFILQHVVDANIAQGAPAINPPPIGVIFSLAGLYLHVEKDSPVQKSRAPIESWGRSSAPGPT